MDKQKLIAAGIDYDTGLSRFGGNIILYEKFLKKFKDDHTMQQARQAVSDKNYDEILKTVHTMKGVTGNLSMDRLHRKCCAVVDAVRAKQFDRIDELFQEVSSEYDIVCSKLD